MNDYFQLSARSTTVAREFRGAVTTFLTMAYILVANPGILGAAGVPQASATACTALAAAICCFLMGFIANFPLAVASGMGLNAVVAFTIVIRLHQTWQTAMGIIVLDGIVMLILVLAGLREAVLRAIPRDLRLAIGAGIGLFIALLGLVNAHLVQMNVPDAPLRAGSLRDPVTAVATAGLILTASLVALRIRGAILIGILLTTCLALVAHLTTIPHGWSRPDFSIAFHADVRSAINWKLLPVLLSVVMVDFFDTLGTATAIAEEAGLVDAKGNLPAVRRILIVDSLAASIGGALGVSSCTAYIESAAGVAEGARTGLHSIFVGIFFLASILLAPWLSVIPPAATAPALILVGFLMIAQLTKINFADPTIAIPAFLTLIIIPLTYSIAHGVGYGFIAYVLISVLTGRPFRVHPVMYAAAAAFGAFFVWGTL